ncbi:uncharacterized protein RHOBADRAFT_54775 [Rhodotorula graminis WP1]|uniref:Zinc-finger domain-containing protein n=1 Tax=Rhodotorula graminis (strain WP1) TaxID=578459 RepID=A0A0P9F1R3_RHOGW|nr:uncharacterized protein RHOBADRAFT_54775 [Rhodotorula graminis WP1]KPV73569.1 hypothetical protein RHOBADRAFT_54775 [Rhodotorula graminis WP1]
MSEHLLFDDLPFQLPPSSSQPPSHRTPPPPPPVARPPVVSSATTSSSMPRATRRGQSLVAALTGQDVPSEPKPKHRKGGPAKQHEPPAESDTSAAPPGFKIVLRAPGQDAASPELSTSPPSTTSAIPTFVCDPSASTPSEPTRTASPADCPVPAAASTSSTAPPRSAASPALRKPRDSTRAGKKQQQQTATPDEVARSCHMHKSHKAQPRMTCLNAPDCRTVWCTKCVVQHYLACTPNGVFEPATLFLCPVCLDVCLCGNCKRQRLAVGRRSTSVDTPVDVKDLDSAAPRPKKKPRRTSTASDMSMPAVVIEQPRRTRKGPDPSLKVEVSDSEGDAASVSRLLRGAVGQGATRATPVEDVKPVVARELAPAAVPAQPAYKLKVKPPRRRSSFDRAYDHPSIYVPLPASATAADRSAPPDPLATAAAAPPSSSMYDKPGRRRPTVPRPPRIPRVPRSAAPPAPASSSSAAAPTPLVPAPAPAQSAHAHGSVFAPTPPAPGSAPAPTYNSRPIMPTAAASRSRRTKRPSTAFDDYALDSATSSAAGLGDRYSPSYEVAQPVASTRKGGRQSGAASATLPSSLKRKAPRRYSGLSSASSCDELSSDDDGTFDDLFDSVPMVVEEQPLPVLAGLEKNLEDGAGSAGESLTFDEFGLALNLESAESMSARPKVKWIEGPERRRRRAMAAAAVAAVAAGETETSDAPTPEPVVAIDSSTSVSPSVPLLSLPATTGESPVPPGGLGARSTSEQPPASGLGRDKKAEPARAASEEQPPPYEAHYPRSSSSAAPLRPPASAPPATAAPGDDLRGRSPTDAKLAFALLDAVRAAVAPRDGSSSSGSSATAHGNGCGSFGAAIDALFGTTQHGLTSSSTSTSLVNSPAKPSSTDAASASPVPSSRSAAHHAVNVDLDAATAEAERRRATLAAAAEVDPVKAFKPLAAERADAQFFGAPVPLVEDDDSVDLSVQQGPVVSRRDTDDSAFGGFDDVFEFEIGSPVDDLWTPASAAESVGASARSTSTAPSSAFDERGGGVAANTVHAGLDDAAGPFSASASATPVERNAHDGAQSCVSPTRGLLADALACGMSVDGMLPLSDEDRAWSLPVPMEDVRAA